MKAMSAIVISLMVTASRALAVGAAPEGGGSGLLTECLLAVLVMIVLFQFIPGMALLIESVKGIFAPSKTGIPTGSDSD
jgi:hypothetical protein